MFTPLILFFGLTVATAVIAHWSDNLGKKLGKKRVSLLGLRPRTTATVLTIASSWCIMLFTLAALLLAVAPLRRMLFSYDRERAEAQSDREKANSQIEAARERIKSTQLVFNSAKIQLTQAQSNLARAKASIAASQQAEKEAGQAATQAEAAGQEVEKLARKQIEVSRSRVAEAQKQLDEAREGLAQAQKANAVAQRQVNVNQSLSREANRNLNIARNKTILAQKLYKKTQNQYETAQKNLSVTKKSLYASTKQLFSVSGELLKTERQLKNTEQQLALNSFLAEAFLANDAPVKVNQVFAAGQIVANQRPEALVAQLRALLQRGQRYFVEIEDMEPVARFPPDATLQLAPRDVTDGSGKLVRLQGEPLLRFHASAMRNQTTANLISVRLIAFRNHLEGERSIGVQFVFVPIKPAFSAGETLASSTIDGAQGDARIFRSLLDLIDFGELEARKRGVDPPKSPDATDFYAKDTRDKIFETLRRIEGTKSRLSVNLVTARALTTVEQLQVRFEIEERPIS